MNFKIEMQNYFELRVLDKRKEKIQNMIFQLEKMQNVNDPVNSLNLVESILEYNLLVDNNDDRFKQNDRAVELIQIARPVLREKRLIKQLLRSYHLECFIKYRTIKYKDEKASIQDILNLSGKIIETILNTLKEYPPEVYRDYLCLGYAWRAYGLALSLIHRFKELTNEQKKTMLKNARELVQDALELSYNTSNRQAHFLSAYIYAFVVEITYSTRGDKVTTESDFKDFMSPYKILFEVAREYGALEFEYLALLNHVRLNLHRIVYAAGVSESKKKIFNEILADCKKLEEYENLIRLPHMHFYRHIVLADVYTSIVYFEAVKEKKLNYYVDKAMKSTEKMKHLYESSKMKAPREKVWMNHFLIEIYMLKASFVIELAEKLDYLKKCEEILLMDEKSQVIWSPKPYVIWRDLCELYLDLSKLERSRIYFKNCIYYAKKVYNSALETENFIDALFATYTIAIIAEDFQNYALSMKYYESAYEIIDEITQAGKDYPYYHKLKTYLQARLQGVKAKESHRTGNYSKAMDLYHNASSLLQSHLLYSYEGVLFDVYALFEEAFLHFIEENYRETLKILSNAVRLFDETSRNFNEFDESQFQSLIDRRAYDLQKLYLESSKAFCVAQSNILQALIHRNTGDSEKSIELLKEANILLESFTDRNIHIAGYYSFTNGLYGLEKSELAIKTGDYKDAVSYLISASGQFDNASRLLASDERLSQLCEGLKFFCKGWMYALEIRRRDIDLNPSELNKNFTLAHQSFESATKSLKMFKKTSNGVSGFEKLLRYIHYSLLFKKTDIHTEKSKYKDKMTEMLSEALQYFKVAEDKERHGFVRDLLATLPQIEITDERVFKPIAIPLTPYTPVFDTTTKLEPSGVNYVISIDKNHAEVDEEIRYSIQITSDTSVYVKQIEGVFPKKGIKVVQDKQLAKNGKVEINSFLSPGPSIVIEFTIRASTPFYNRTHPQLIYLNSKKEKCHAFTSPLTLQVYPKQVLKTGVVSKINEKIGLVEDIMEELGITLGEFPIIYHDINSYREALAEYYFRYETEEGGKNPPSKKTDISKIPIQQMAFVEPLGEVNILYDLETYLYPQSIANLLGIIIHEKFGHGFFQQFTTLGKKLLELEYHHKGIELLMKELEKISNKYATGIQWLAVSTLIVDEGFATWLELKIFEKLLEKISDKDPQFIQQIHHEIDSFKKTVFESEELNVRHDYFALKYEKPIINPYALGYDLFSQIEEKYGEKCVPKALEIAANVSLTRRQISLMPNTIKNDKNCADKRLEKIALSDLKIARNNVDMFEKAAKKLFL